MLLLFQKLRLLLIWFTYSTLTLWSCSIAAFLQQNLRLCLIWKRIRATFLFLRLKSEVSFFFTCGPDPLQSSLSPPPAAISEASATVSFPHPHCVYQVQIRHINLMHWVFTQPKICQTLCLLWSMSQCEERDSHMAASSSDQIKICILCLYHCHLAHIYCCIYLFVIYCTIRETKQTKRP